VDGDGRPIEDLKSGDFRITIDGKARSVVSAGWVPLARPRTSAPSPAPPEGYSSNENTTSGRLFLIAVDQPNIRFDGVMRLRSAVDGFIDRIQPSDPIAAVGLGHSVSTPFTTNRDAVKKALSLMSGESERGRTLKAMGEIQYWHDLAISTVEAVEIYQGNTSTVDGVAGRECKMRPEAYESAFRRGLVTTVAPSPPPTPVTLTSDYDLSNCRERIASNGRLVGSAEVASREQTLMSLRSLLKALTAIDAPKTVVLVSEGFSVTDDPRSVMEIGALSAAARTSIYVLKLDDQPFDVSQSAPTFLAVGDRQAMAAGLDMIASSSRGAMFNVMGNGSAALGRLERELSGYYLVGVESVPTDTDGKAHPINVQVSRRGAVVRARRELADPATAKAGKSSPLEEIAAALSSPLVVPSLPLRLATFSMRDPKESKIQVVIHADVGTEYTSAQAVTLGYVITDSKGAVVINQTGTGRLPPAIRGAPSPLVFAGSATLEPGEYMLKLAIAEGDRVGSVEHPIHANLIDAGVFKLSELMIGGPIDAGQLSGPTVGYEIRFGTVQGYIEAYGSSASLLTMRYEVAPGLNDPSLFSAVVPGRAAGDDRNVFSYAMPVRELPPGQYYLRASLSQGTDVVKRVARAFRVEAAPVIAAAGVAATVPRTIALAVRDEVLDRRFRREEVSRPDTVQGFRDTLAAGASRAFDEGIASLVKGDDARAEQSFRSVIEAGLAGADTTAALAYLGATFAATGRDVEAISIWQIALIDGSGFPHLYEWLGDAFMRVRNVDEARPLLEEAMGKWPGEVRFAKPLAIAYAKSGRGRDALMLLERYLGEHRDDIEALYLGVEWVYQLHTAGASMRSREEDLKVGRAWADAYTIANGPQVDDVKRWMLSMETAPAPAPPVNR
jgi:VWFA-related protein